MKTNHQRSYKAKKDSERYKFSPMGGIKTKSVFAQVAVAASWGGDNSNGHKGYAKVKRGAKKFVRTRLRFHENAQTKKEAFLTEH